MEGIIKLYKRLNNVFIIFYIVFFFLQKGLVLKLVLSLLTLFNPVSHLIVLFNLIIYYYYFLINLNFIEQRFYIYIYRTKCLYISFTIRNKNKKYPKVQTKPKYAI